MVVVIAVTGAGVMMGLSVMDTGEGDGSFPPLLLSRSQPHDIDSMDSVAIGVSNVLSPSRSPGGGDSVERGWAGA